MNFSCDSCGLTLEATPELVGETVQCPGCAKELIVPQQRRRRSNVITSVANAEAEAALEAEDDQEQDFDSPQQPPTPTLTRRGPALPRPGSHPPIHTHDEFEEVEYYEDAPRPSILPKVFGFLAALALIAGAMWFFILRQPGGNDNADAPVQLTFWHTPDSVIAVVGEMRSGNVTPKDGQQLLVTVFKIASALLVKEGDSESASSTSFAVELDDFRLFPEKIDKAFKPEGGAPLMDSEGNAPFFVGQVPGMTAAGPSTSSMVEEFVKVSLFWSLPTDVLERGGEIEIQFKDHPPVILPDALPEDESEGDAKPPPPLELPVGRVEQLFSAGDKVPRWEPDAGQEAVALTVRTPKGMSEREFVSSECSLRDAAGRSQPCAGIWLTNELIIGGDTFSTPEPVLLRLVFGVEPDQKSFTLRYRDKTIGKIALTPGAPVSEASGAITVAASSAEAAFSVLNEVQGMGDAIGLTGTFTQRWGAAAQAAAEDNEAVREQEKMIAEAKQRAEEARKPRLPDDFAFSALTEWRPGNDLVEIERAGKKLIVAYFKADEAVLAVDEDIVVGLQPGRKGLVVDQRVISNGLIQNTLFAEGVLSYETSGSLRTLTDSKMAQGETNDGRGNASSPAPKIGWKPESFVCLRGDEVLGTWDARSRELREARPSEKSAARGALQAVKRTFGSTILDLVKKGEAPPQPRASKPSPAPPEPAKPAFPTEIREWTDSAGRKLRGRVMSYSPSEGTVQIEISKSGKVATFQIDRLSVTDRDYILELHSGKSP